MQGKILFLDLTDQSTMTLAILKALNSETRLQILAYLGERTVNVNEIAAALQIAPSSATTHIQILEKADLIRTEFIPATHGLQKLCARTYDNIHIRIEHSTRAQNTFSVTMPVGQYYDFNIRPTCGLVNESSLIGLMDTPASFYEPGHVHAQLIWFGGAGYVAYRFPNHLPAGTQAVSLELSAELCSEAPLHHLDWPSDITLWVNGVEVGTWTSPADFGGKRGLLTPEWWELKDTQYGQLKVWSVTPEGSFIDGVSLDGVRTADLHLGERSYIDIRLGVKATSQNVGGMNLFGERFGNYPQSLILRVNYAYTDPKRHHI